VEEIGVLAVGRGRHDLSATGEHVHLQDRLVRQAAAERRRLDAETGDGATERDGAELRHDLRDVAEGQQLVDERLVRAHALDVGRGRSIGRYVDGDDAVEPVDIEARRVSGPAWTEEVGRALRQPNRITRSDRLERRDERVDGLRVTGPTLHPSTVGQGTDHRKCA
jgi:hypothetical protein